MSDMNRLETLTSDSDKKFDLKEEIFDWIESILFSIFVASLIFTFVFRIAQVDGGSMIPTLQHGDRLILSGMFYKPDNKDIIAINSKGLNEPIIKRVIAIEGQTVDIDFEQGKVYVDGKEQFEPYINDITKNDFGIDAAFSEYPVTVPEGYVFVLGDNRNDSIDSREYRVGFVSKEDIIGKAVFRIYPFNTFGFLK